MGVRTRGAKAFAGIVALAAGFAVTVLQPSATLAELCGGKESSGCTGGSMGGGNTDAHDEGDFSPPTS